MSEYAGDPLAPLRAEAETRMFEQFDPVVLSRLVLIPAWTDALAAAVGLWTRKTGPEALEVLEEADIVERRQVLASGGRRQEEFWVRARARTSLVGYLHTVRPRLDHDLDQLVNVVGRLETSAFGVTAWFEVASRYRRDNSGLDLVVAVDELVAAGRIAVATNLVAAARALGEVTGGPLADASRRAGWHIERAYRANVDNEALRFYVNRSEPEKAIDELIEPSSSWALHLLGGGGVGKTMLIRYLASGRYAAERGRPMFPVARADFDYLDPRYPQERPAELLLALAHELVSFGDTRAVYQFYRRFQDAANHLHEECRRPDPDEGLLRGLQERVVEQFARVVTEARGPGNPVVLILDTCEELAKLYPAGARAPAIDRTFGMLEELKTQAPGVRVLLAGRRWLTPAADEGTRAAGPRLLDRPYLRVLHLQGLPADEAASYVDLRAAQGAGRRPDPALRDAILDRACEPDGSGRYNPFELASYCEWAYSDNPPDADELRDAPGDPYVELRIIGRIMDDVVRQALPAAVEFGRFDVELIRPALRRVGIDADKAFAGLAGQEWTRALTVTAAGFPGVIEVDEHLRNRIRAVLVKTNAYTVGDPVHLGRDAAELIEGGPVRDVPAEVVEAAVRLLPAVEAAVMWDKLEGRIVAESAWPWAETVTMRAGAVEVRRPGQETILAAILATQAAARIHAGLIEGLADLWRQVADVAGRYPVRAGGVWLDSRARLGLIAVGEPVPADPGALAAEAAARRGDLGSLVAALDGPIGRGEQPPATLVTVVTDIADHAPHGAALAGALLALATLALQDGKLRLAANMADVALAAAMRAGETPETAPGRDCSDWRPPPGLTDRCRLVCLLIACRLGEWYDPGRFQAWRSSALERPYDVDAQRLAAFTVQYELGHRPVPAEVLAALEAEVPPARALTWVHRQVRPLAAVLAEAWLVLGDPGRAAQVLRAARDRTVELVGDDPETIEELQLALLSLCRRGRTAQYASLLQLCYDGPPAVRAEAWLVRTLLNGDRPQSPAEAGSWHGWWRCQDARSLQGKAPAPPDSEAGISALDTMADWLEYQALMNNAGLAGPALAPPLSEPAARQWMLLPGPVISALPSGIVGRAMLAAGEVLALRLPEVAAGRLHEAAGHLDAAGDRLGAVQALVLADLARARAGAAGSGATRPVADSQAVLTMAEAPQWHGWSSRLEAWMALPALTPSCQPGDSSPETDFGVSAGTAGVARRWWQPRITTTRLLYVTFVLTPIVALAVVALVLNNVVLPLIISAFLGGAGFIGAVIRAIFKDFFTIVAAISIRPAGDGAATLTGRSYGDFTELRKGSHSRGARGNRFFNGKYKWTADVALEPSEPVDGHGLPARVAPPGFTVVILEVDPRVEPCAWEQRLGQVGRRKLRRLLFMRTVPGDPPSTGPDEWLRSSAVYLGPRALAPLKPVSPRLTDSGDGDGETRPGRRVMYLIGTPVSTSAGWRMRISSGASAETVESGRGTVTDEELVSMDSLDLSGTQLVVLQAEPLDGPPRALGDLGPGFRALAREAAETGAGTVIVVPTLPDSEAAQMVSVTWSKFASGKTGSQLEHLLALAVEAKKLCYVEDPPDGEQPALDVLIYVRARQFRKES
jgi:hypothetical protein